MAYNTGGFMGRLKRARKLGSYGAPKDYMDNIRVPGQSVGPDPFKLLEKDSMQPMDDSSATAMDTVDRMKRRRKMGSARGSSESGLSRY